MRPWRSCGARRGSMESSSSPFGADRYAGLTDLRHTWATLHMQAGTPLHVVQQLGGWAGTQMTQRYAHFSPGHLAGHLDAFGDQVRFGVYDSATQEEGAGAQ